jgi:hypothetical protein
VILFSNRFDCSDFKDSKPPGFCRAQSVANIFFRQEFDVRPDLFKKPFIATSIRRGVSQTDDQALQGSHARSPALT